METKNAAGSELEAYKPRKLTFAQNAVLSLKIAGALGLIGAAIWAIDLWTAAP